MELEDRRKILEHIINTGLFSEKHLEFEWEQRLLYTLLSVYEIDNDSPYTLRQRISFTVVFYYQEESIIVVLTYHVVDDMSEIRHRFTLQNNPYNPITVGNEIINEVAKMDRLFIQNNMISHIPF